MTDTVSLWRGPFGDEYHVRNRVTPDQVKEVFARILNGITVNSVLEVGSGLGANLAAIDAKVKTGVEPNERARDEAKATYPEIAFLDGEAADLPLFEQSFDLVLTCGLLIHIPPEDLTQAMQEICRVSRRYVLAIEYAAVEEEEPVTYRGKEGILWRRPFGKLYEYNCGMKVIARGDSTDSDLYPGCAWWLCQK